MKALIVYAHPNPKSFCKAIADVAREELERLGHEVRLHDLYAQGWSPALGPEDFEALFKGTVREDVAREQADVLWADLLVFVYPIWWYERPAMVKGWFDRVFSVGFAYQATAQGIQGLLGGRRALVLTTSGADEESDRKSGMTEAMRVTVMSGSLRSTGLNPVHYKNYFAVPLVTDARRAEMLEDVRAQVRAVLAEQRAAEPANAGW
ncbi:MAG: NAD(P)H-dependent oxidoreductase [Myxococcales bacterium]|jgi:NAD(P)H dehydrogenase (quinone)